MTPQVSVLLTAYNRERHIVASIESVLGQTFGDFELLIVDDRSADGTVEIARRYERQDPRVRVFVNERNLGDYPNRNHAASHARGEFLKYHDSDDLMYPHCLEVMVRMLASEPRAGFALSTGTAWPGGPCPMLLTPRMAYQREFLGNGMFMCGPAGALFRAAVFRELGGFVDAGAPSDYLFWLHACARVPAVLVPADLFWYRIHPSQEFQSDKAQRDYAATSGAAWRALHASECPLTPEECEQARRNCVFTLAKKMWRDARAGRFALASYRYRMSALPASAWIRYLRPPRRDVFAGTPFDTDGDFITPKWARYPRASA